MNSYIIITLEKDCLLQSYIMLKVYNKEINPSTLPITGRKQGGFRPNKMHTMNSYIWCRCIATKRYNKDQQLRCLKELFREIHRGKATSHISAISASESAMRETEARSYCCTEILLTNFP